LIGLLLYPSVQSAPIAGFLHAPQNDDHFVFLPFVSRTPPPGIYGRITCAGEPLPGITLTLWHFDVISRGYVLFRYTETQNDGSYRFSGLPSLPQDPGAMYYVTYENGDHGNADNPAYLGYWLAPAITSYEAGQNVSGGDFDLANVGKLTPAGGATVPFPVTFTWEPRPTSPEDSYTFEVYWQGEYYRHPWFTEFDLGYVGAYTLDTLPYDFAYQQEYEWNLRIRWPDGSYGSGYAGRTVTFSP